MSPVMLFRKSLAEESEFEVAARHFDVIESRAELSRRVPPFTYARTARGEILVNVPEQPLVVARYSALPYYKELETDVELLGGKLINSYREHRYVADLQNWYADFESITPKTWFTPSDVPMEEEGAFVLKGETNSRKQKWETHMYAPTRADVGRVLANLSADPLIGADQSIYVREYCPLVCYGSSINGLPISREFRFFILDGEILASGFYWSEHVDHIVEKFGALEVNEPPTQWAREHIALRLVGKIRFAVADVAQMNSGEWVLIELNDGQQSGLSCVDPEILYAAMKERLS